MRSSTLLLLGLTIGAIAQGAIAPAGADIAANGDSCHPASPALPEALLKALQAIKGKPPAVKPFRIDTGLDLRGHGRAWVEELQDFEAPHRLRGRAKMAAPAVVPASRLWSLDAPPPQPEAAARNAWPFSLPSHAT